MEDVEEIKLGRLMVNGHSWGEPVELTTTPLLLMPEEVQYAAASFIEHLIFPVACVYYFADDGKDHSERIIALAECQNLVGRISFVANHEHPAVSHPKVARLSMSEVKHFNGGGYVAAICNFRTSDKYEEAITYAFKGTPEPCVQLVNMTQWPEHTRHRVWTKENDTEVYGAWKHPVVAPSNWGGAEETEPQESN